MASHLNPTTSAKREGFGRVGRARLLGARSTICWRAASLPVDNNQGRGGRTPAHRLTSFSMARSITSIAIGLALQGAASESSTGTESILHADHKKIMQPSLSHFTTPLAKAGGWPSASVGVVSGAVTTASTGSRTSLSGLASSAGSGSAGCSSSPGDRTCRQADRQARRRPAGPSGPQRRRDDHRPDQPRVMACNGFPAVQAALLFGSARTSSNGIATPVPLSRAEGQP
jgi:hypothetical protein